MRTWRKVRNFAGQKFRLTLEQWKGRVSSIRVEENGNL